MVKKASDIYSSELPPSFVAEVTARYGLPHVDLQQALRITSALIPEEVTLLEELAALDTEHRRRLVHGLRSAVTAHHNAAVTDPLAEVDESLDWNDSVEAVVWADLEAAEHRARVLRESLSAGAAGRLTGRSRQAVERQRGAGRLLALRLGRQWRYPAWQFDADGPGGLVPHLPEVVAHLHLSPAGAAHWLTRQRPELDGATAISLLRHRNPVPVLRLAEQQSHLP